MWDQRTEGRMDELTGVGARDAYTSKKWVGVAQIGCDLGQKAAMRLWPSSGDLQETCFILPFSAWETHPDQPMFLFVC